jgi:hypothetical protein
VVVVVALYRCVILSFYPPHLPQHRRRSSPPTNDNSIIPVDLGRGSTSRVFCPKTRTRGVGWDGFDARFYPHSRTFPFPRNLSSSGGFSKKGRTSGSTYSYHTELYVS